MAANAEIFFEHDRWGRNLLWSAGLHVLLTAAIVGRGGSFVAIGSQLGRGGRRRHALGVTTGEHGGIALEACAGQECAGETSRRGVSQSGAKSRRSRSRMRLRFLTRSSDQTGKAGKPVVSESQRKPQPQPPSGGEQCRSVWTRWSGQRAVRNIQRGRSQGRIRIYGRRRRFW